MAIEGNVMHILNVAFRARLSAAQQRDQPDMLPSLVELTHSVLEIEGSDICAICLEKPECGQMETTLPCSHVFHWKCMDTWIKHDKTTCPVCRMDLCKTV
uniref:RING-type domain-containing protein n=1 Tax=Strigamia maritima TaxID=126957 RepID=T1IXM2_STRMM